jgi:hypothetical protein
MHRGGSPLRTKIGHFPPALSRHQSVSTDPQGSSRGAPAAHDLNTRLPPPHSRAPRRRRRRGSRRGGLRRGGRRRAGGHDHAGCTTLLPLRTARCRIASRPRVSATPRGAHGDIPAWKTAFASPRGRTKVPRFTAASIMTRPRPARRKGGDAGRDFMRLGLATLHTEKRAQLG